MNDKSSGHALKHVQEVTTQQIDTFVEKRDEHNRLRETGDLKSQRIRLAAEKLLTRSTSGFIYVAVIVVCLYLGPLTTALLVAAMAWLCCSEFFRMMRMCGRMPSEIIGLAAAVAFPFTALVGIGWSYLLMFCMTIALGLWYIGTPRANISDVSVTIFGPLYTSFLLTSVVYIRLYNPGFDGAFLTFAVMGSIWLNDSCAYLVGSRLGRHKLAPRISPNKSWEGFIGGLIASCIIWFAIYWLQLVPVGLFQSLGIALCVGLFAVIGDLFESRIKRGVGVKDSGNVMPGHGGLLDRSDSLLFGVMAAHILLKLGGIL